YEKYFFEWHLFSFHNSIEHISDRALTKALYLFKLVFFLMKKVQVRDMLDKPSSVKCFDCLMSQTFYIHGLTTDKMLHFTNNLRWTIFIIRTVVNSFSFFS